MMMMMKASDVKPKRH